MIYDDWHEWYDRIHVGERNDPYEKLQSQCSLGSATNISQLELAKICYEC